MICCFSGITLLATLALAQAPPSPDKLPINRVVLYKNGVGYFEHLGPVHDNQNVSIAFTSGQLNDVLKSLTVLDLSGGKITGVGYGSSAPIDRQRGDIRLPLGEKTSLTEFLEAVRGSRIEIKTGPATLSGRLLSVERKTRISGGNSLEIDYVSLINESGEVRTIELSPAFSVRLLEKGLTDKISRYLDLTSATRDADVRQMVISSEGTGDRTVFLSYISEVPVWKATYRIVLDAKHAGNPLIQGWAIIDNTVGQDWENVQLSLVAGAPQSFVQNLSQPYYARRPVVAMPDTGSIRPQTYEATLFPGAAMVAGTITDPSGAVVPGATVKAYDNGRNLVGESRTDGSGRYRLMLPEGTIRLNIEMGGFQKINASGITAMAARPVTRDFVMSLGSMSETVTVNAEAMAVNTEGSVLSSSGRSMGSGTTLGGLNNRIRDLPLGGRSAANSTGLSPGAVSEARQHSESSALAQDLGDLFEYKLKERITVERNRSAMVPIVQSPITAEKVSVFNDRAGSAHPMRALWLSNSTETTLDGGTFSVLEAETFAGEGIFESIRPDEKRLISYAVDLGVTGSWKNFSDRQRVSRVRINKGVMTQVSELREYRTYVFRNEDSTPRTILVEHPVRSGYEMRGMAKPDETTADWMRFRLPVASKQTASLVVEEARTLESTFQISNLDSDRVALFVRDKSVDPKIEAALKEVMTQRAVVNELDTKEESLDEERTKIFDSQQRLRENMKALKGSPEEKVLLQRYTSQLNQQETRLESIDREVERLQPQKDAAQEKLDKIIENLSFDEKL